MAGWRSAEGDSGSLLEFRLAGFLPVERRQLGDLLVGRKRVRNGSVLSIDTKGRPANVAALWHGNYEWNMRGQFIT
jgi:hypothetical protein